MHFDVILRIRTMLKDDAQKADYFVRPHTSVHNNQLWASRSYSCTHYTFSFAKILIIYHFKWRRARTQFTFEFGLQVITWYGKEYLIILNKKATVYTFSQGRYRKISTYYLNTLYCRYFIVFPSYLNKVIVIRYSSIWA